MTASKNPITPLADAAVGRELVRMVEELGADPRAVFDTDALNLLRRTQPGDEIASAILMHVFDQAAKSLHRPDLGIAFAEWATI